MKPHNVADLFEGLAAGLMGKSPNPYLATGPLHMLGRTAGEQMARELKNVEAGAFYLISDHVDPVIAAASVYLEKLTPCEVGQHQDGRHLEKLGTCFNRYECRRCGQAFDVDSSG